MKKLLTAMLTFIIITTCLCFTACGKPDDPNNITIGILQIATHSALDSAREGFKVTLNDWAKNNGKTIKFVEENANEDKNSERNLAKSIASGKPQIMLGISTSSARALSLCKGKIPTLFTAVTDPVAEGLTTKSNVTGTSDLNPVKEQIALIKEFVPGVKKIGFLYNSAESNSVKQFNLAKEKCTELGLQLIPFTASSASDITTVLNSVPDKVEAVYVPTDNLMAKNIKTICTILHNAKVPVIAGEAGICKDGEAVATLGIDYKKLGVQTAKIAIKILEGEDIGSIKAKEAFQYYSEPSSFFVNEENAIKAGISQATIDAVKAKHN